MTKPLIIVINSQQVSSFVFATDNESQGNVHVRTVSVRIKENKEIKSNHCLREIRMHT